MLCIPLLPLLRYKNHLYQSNQFPGPVTPVNNPHSFSEVFHACTHCEWLRFSVSSSLTKNVCWFRIAILNKSTLVIVGKRSALVLARNSRPWSSTTELESKYCSYITGCNSYSHRESLAKICVWTAHKYSWAGQVLLLIRYFQVHSSAQYLACASPLQKRS